MRSWLLRDGHALAVNFVKDRVAPALKQGVPDRFAEPHRIISVARFPQNLAAVRMSNDSFQVQLAVAHLGKSADRNLAAATEPVEKWALARGSRAGRSVVEEGKMLARLGVSGANLNSQSSLSCGWAHDLRRNNLPHQFVFPKPIQTGSGKNNGVVLPG